MKKFILATALGLTLTGCVEVGPPLGNERDRRAYNGLEEVRKDNVYYDYYYDTHGYYYRGDGYYDRSGRFYPYATPVTTVVVEKHRDAHDHDVNDDGIDDYNPHNGHDRWARRTN